MQNILDKASEYQLFGADDDDNDGDTERDEEEELHAIPRLNLLPDIWALQEVDMDEVLAKYLTSMGYEGIETPRMKIGAGAGGKADSCGLYFRKDRFEVLEQEMIRLDDLATLMPNDTKIDSINNNLQSLQRSFLRRNVAMLVRLQSIDSPDMTLVVAVAHLFWNPICEYVKLCQTHYVMLRAKAFLRNDNEAFVLCGDLNSLPGSSVHEYLTKGHVNAKVVAPWYREGTHFAEEEEEDKIEKRKSIDESNELNGLSNGISGLVIAPPASKLTVSNTNPVSNLKPHSKREQIRYLLDVSLNRLCRWFRILGLDAGLETESEERLRTQKGNIVLFERCRKERRVLITTSNTLLARTNCPAGTYLVNPKSLQGSWEIVLVHILLTHGVVLDPKKFLTRCVVCNGNICKVEDPAHRTRIFAEYSAPVEEDENLAVWQCDGCQQGYWWCDRPTSSASRVMCQATRLYQKCLQAQVPVYPSSERHMFAHLNIKEESRKGWDWSVKGSELLKLKLQATEWLKDSRLTCPIAQLNSAYRNDSDESAEIIPFSNVTLDFEGLLDYIFFNGSCTPTHRLYVPSTYKELNPSALPNGHLLPSCVWPSDHLAIGTRLVLQSEPESRKKENITVDAAPSFEP